MKSLIIISLTNLIMAFIYLKINSHLFHSLNIDLIDKVIKELEMVYY